MSHGSNNHFLTSKRHMEPMKSPCLHFPTCNKLVANQYQSWRITHVRVPLMRLSEVRLHLLNSFFKLVAMSIKDWLLTLKHIEAPKILSWKVSKSGISMEFFKPNTWCKYFIVYAVVIEKVKYYLYLVTIKWTKKEISNLAKFMPKHNRGPTPNAIKKNGFTDFCTINTTTKKTEIVKSRNVTT
jgi:hypothetical protein